MDEEDGERRQQELVEATIREKQQELQALEEIRRENLMARQPPPRTPPTLFSTPTSTMFVLSPPPKKNSAEKGPNLPQAGGKRLLSSPEEVQEAMRRRIAKRREVPAAATVAVAGDEEPTEMAMHERSAGVDPLATAPVTQLAGLATSSTKGIMDAVRCKTSKLNKDEIAAIGAHTERLSAVVAHLTLRLMAAESRAERAEHARGQQQEGEEARIEGLPPKRSFAHALRLGRDQQPVPIPRPLGPSVVIYPADDQKEELKTANDTRRVLLGAVQPGQLGLQIAGVRKVGNAGVVVQTTSAAAADALRKAVPTTLRTVAPAERQPLLALTGIGKDATLEEVLAEIKDQNLQDEDDWTSERLGRELRLLYKRSRHGGRTRWVCQVTQELRRRLVERGRLYIGWDVVEVTDHVSVTCCNRCQLFGHPEKYCRAKQMTCGNCGEDGHKSAECQAASPMCATCKKFGRKGAQTHRTASRDCPARAYAEQRSVSNINYHG